MESGDTVTIMTTSPLVSPSKRSHDFRNFGRRLRRLFECHIRFFQRDHVRVHRFRHTGLMPSTGGTATLPLFDDGDFAAAWSYLRGFERRPRRAWRISGRFARCARGSSHKLGGRQLRQLYRRGAWSNPANIISATESGDVVKITTQN